MIKKKYDEMIEKAMDRFGLLGLWAIAGITGYVSALLFKTFLEFLIRRIWK